MADDQGRKPTLTLVETADRNQQEVAKVLLGGGGDGTSGGMTDDWKTSVDLRLGVLHTDVRTMLRAAIAAAIGLLGVLGGLWVHIDDRFDRANEHISDKIDRATANTSDKFERVNGRISELAVEQQQTAAKVDAMNAKIDLLVAAKVARR